MTRKYNAKPQRICIFFYFELWSNVKFSMPTIYNIYIYIRMYNMSAIHVCPYLLYKKEIQTKNIIEVYLTSFQHLQKYVSFPFVYQAPTCLCAYIEILYLISTICTVHTRCVTPIVSCSRNIKIPGTFVPKRTEAARYQMGEKEMS